MTLGQRLAELFFRSIEWNTRVLVDNTLEMQLKKVEEETLEEKELSDKGEDPTEEIADMFIATAGIARFDMEISLHLMVHVLSGLPITMEALVDAVEKKLEILEERKYGIVDGVYRHQTLQ